MKDNYDRSVQLRCATCGSEDFTFNEDKSYIKCNLCDREYLDGYDELVEFNQENINQTIEVIKDEVQDDLQKKISDMLKETFKGNKNISFE